MIHLVSHTVLKDPPSLGLVSVRLGPISSDLESLCTHLVRFHADTGPNKGAAWIQAVRRKRLPWHPPPLRRSHRVRGGGILHPSGVRLVHRHVHRTPIQASERPKAAAAPERHDECPAAVPATKDLDDMVPSLRFGA